MQVMTTGTKALSKLAQAGSPPQDRLSTSGSTHDSHPNGWRLRQNSADTQQSFDILLGNGGIGHQTSPKPTLAIA